jgi:hypothetical protein
VGRHLVDRSLRAIALVASLSVAGVGQAAAQDSAAAAPAEEERPTGLPKKIQWHFNLDAAIGGFGFAHSLYTNERPDPSGNLGDNWAESYAKPALSAEYGLSNGSQLYGKISVVGERTFGAPPSLVGEDASSFKIEDGYVGWRSGKTVGKTENELDFTIGRTQYTLGHGLILWDGGGEGGTRGGFWSNARKAWNFATVGRFKPGHHTVEAFYLDRDEVPEADSHTHLWGANYQYQLGEANTLGATYLHFWADPAVKPNRDGLNVINLRAYTAPIKDVPDLAIDAEYVREDNGNQLGSNAWNLQGAYTLSKVTWKPRISYRYAFFQGDDPATTKSEGFDALIPGFYDWGAWWQGEIAGEYFLSNSNLISHQIRVHATPNDAIGTGLIFYKFNLDQIGGFAPVVTSSSLATELDGYCDWKINSNFLASFVAALAWPGTAVEQAYGRTQNFVYGMIYVAYSY